MAEESAVPSRRFRNRGLFLPGRLSVRRSSSSSSSSRPIDNLRTVFLSPATFAIPRSNRISAGPSISARQRYRSLASLGPVTLLAPVRTPLQPRWRRRRRREKAVIPAECIERHTRACSFGSARLRYTSERVDSRVRVLLASGG